MINITPQRYTLAGWEDFQAPTDWSLISNKPDTYTPVAHVTRVDELTNLDLSTVGRVHFDGDESWQHYDTINAYSIFIIVNHVTNSGCVLSDLDTSISSIFTQVNNITSGLNEGFWWNHNIFAVSILTNKLVSNDVVGFQTWLQANNLVVYYKLSGVVPSFTFADLKTWLNYKDATAALSYVFDSGDGQLARKTMPKVRDEIVTQAQVEKVSGVSAAKIANWDGAYTHSQAAHAPANAQKNSDITQAEIEAALLSEITSHWHPYMKHSTGNQLGLYGVAGDPQVYYDGAGIYYDLYHEGNLAAGAGPNDFCAGDDSRLSDSRSANDVYSWAKAETKPAYNQDEVGDGSTYFRVTQGEKTNLASAYNHSVAAHAPSNAQKNADITLAEIEARLTGEITGHYHSSVKHTSGNQLGLYGINGTPQYYADGAGLYYDLYHTGNKPLPYSSIKNFTAGTTSNGTTAVALATTHTFAAGDVIGLCLRSSSGADGADSIVWVKLGATAAANFGAGFFPSTSAGTGMTYYHFEVYYSGSTLYLDDTYVCSVTTGPTFDNTTTTGIYVYDVLLLA